MEIVILLAVAGFFGAVFTLFKHRESVRGAAYHAVLTKDEPAFEGDASYNGLTPDRVRQIRPFVDRVGVVRINEPDPNRQGRNAPMLEWEIYLLDVNGVFHEVVKLHGEIDAAERSLEVAGLLDAPLDDPERITAGRR